MASSTISGLSNLLHWVYSYSCVQKCTQTLNLVNCRYGFLMVILLQSKEIQYVQCPVQPLLEGLTLEWGSSPDRNLALDPRGQTSEQSSSRLRLVRHPWP